MRNAITFCFAALLTSSLAASATGVPVAGTFSAGAESFTIRDVSAERLAPGGADDPAWRLVFSEQPHEHSAAGRERALDGEHGLAFTVELLASGEGHLFVLYRREPGATTAYPSSFPWPQVTDFAADGERARGRVRNNADFPFGEMTFDLRFDAPIVTP